ncbi:uncharacterized protein LOC129906387 [Episyrphus balteatus]|uniref:uncharacterized protein LOC129906387 n=1 Tax=Episyrphus balteatus TaxID=286459 RepID=UPI002485DC01|nr:uncharacterized protein LOC129906387 [Episyrphus balteatus]
MFSILIRDTARNLRNSIFKTNNLPNALIAFDYSSFTTKDFLYTNYDDTGTLLLRFMKYLAMEKSQFAPLIPTTIRYPDFFPVTDSRSFQSELKKTDITQIPNLIIFAFTYKCNGDPQKFVGVINEIDWYCENNLPKMDLDTILRTLYAFMFLLPGKVTHTNFYGKCLNELVGKFDKDCPAEKFVKVCFYLGLNKKNQNGTVLLKKFLHSYLNQYLPELTPLDLSIVGNAAYKASIPINSSEFMDKITTEILQLDPSAIDDSLLVNLLKILRFNKVKSKGVCEKLDTICSQEQLKKFEFMGLTHIFAYFTEFQWNQKQTCSKFIKEALSRIQSSKAYKRPKDMSTFLWCCAQLQQGDLLSSNDLRHIDSIILRMIERNEFKYHPDQLINSALSLWMMGHKSRGLIAEVTSLRMNPNANNPDRAKLDSRHKVLLSSVSIEEPEWLMRGKKQYFVESLAAPDYLVNNRVGLKKAFDKLKEEGVEAELVSPIDGINVAGILVKLGEDQKCYLEVLEDEHYLKFNEVPVAIVQLKIRLLKHMGYNVVTVRANDVDKLDSIKSLITGAEESSEVKQNAAV